MRTLTPLVAAVVAAALSGCCTSRHCQPYNETELRYSFAPTALQMALGQGTGKYSDILVLSGGGSRGAWGAGVLRGWRENANKPRPTFRLVTGVSTGALLATYAFLGQPEDDDLLERAYTTIRTKNIYHDKFLPFALFSDSIKSSKPLKRTIAKYITTNTLNRVAAAWKAGRELCVGTANLDTGRLVIWDLTKIAADVTNPQRLELYREVVYASASVPIAVPPVNISGTLYCDGGVRAQLFFMKHFLPAARDSKGGRRPSAQPLRVHVIVNGQLGVQTNCVCDHLTDSSLKKGILPRTLEMLLDANANGDLYRVDDVCKELGARCRMCWIPSDYPQLSSSEEFDPAQMRKLYEAGRDFGRTNSVWETTIPSP
jgi:Patatin-like phospholipase